MSPKAGLGPGLSQCRHDIQERTTHIQRDGYRALTTQLTLFYGSSSLPTAYCISISTTIRHVRGTMHACYAALDAELPGTPPMPHTQKARPSLHVTGRGSSDTTQGIAARLHPNYSSWRRSATNPFVTSHVCTRQQLCDLLDIDLDLSCMHIHAKPLGPALRKEQRLVLTTELG